VGRCGDVNPPAIDAAGANVNDILDGNPFAPLADMNEEEEPEYLVNIIEENDDTGDESEYFLENSVNVDGSNDDDTETYHPANDDTNIDSWIWKIGVWTAIVWGKKCEWRQRGD
jgi:hypothetical protein